MPVQHNRRANPYLRTAAAALLMVCGQSLGQSDTASVDRPPAALSQGRQPPRDPLAITGRNFADMLVPGAVQIANVDLAGSKTWIWSETGGGTGENPVQRLFIQGDVQADIGTYRFSAAQAVVWIEQLTQGEADRAPSRQIAIYFDRVSDPGAEAGFAQSGDRLLVTGVLQGELAVRFDALLKGRPDGADAQLVREGERRLAEFLREQAGFSPAGTRARAAATGPRRPGVDRPFEPNSPLVGALPDEEVVEPEPDRQSPIFGSDGVITFAVGTNRHQPEPGAPPDEGEPVRVIAGQNGEDTTVMMSGGVLLQYLQSSRNRTLQINAQRAVVFLEPGPLTELLRFDVDRVKGLYLEGDVVASDGTYTIRGPRVYYDVKSNRATMVDAIFSTYDARRGIPIYVRAQEIRQQSAQQWETRKARLSSTSFFNPLLQIGTTSVTITQESTPRTSGGGDGGSGPDMVGGGGAGGAGGFGDGQEGVGEDTRTRFDAKGVTLQAGGVPFFWYPRFRGELENFPLKDLRFENSSGSGTAIKTAWDYFGATGTRAPEGVDLNILADLYFDRGPGIGADGDWQSEDAKGRFLAYTLPSDNGQDSLSSGAKKSFDHEFRGIVLAEHLEKFNEYWSLQLEGGTISDETFVDAFFREYGVSGREFTNAAFLRRQEDNTAFSLLFKGEHIDFTPNQYLLQSLGYNTDKLPELRYTRLADSIFSGNSPGWLTYSSDYRATRMNLNFTEPTASELGFDTLTRSMAAFGLAPNQSIGDRLRAEGYTESDVMRFDTRHEFVGTFDLEPFKLNPFVVGRLTGYDQTFDEFSGDSEQDSYRTWYSTGVRASTQITRIDDSVESDLFDLHRTRHIIEPNATVWYAGANLSQNDIPVYDDEVESLATGASVRAGLTQTWQTQRGGPGRWRNVDFVTLRTDYISSTADADRESPIGRFFDYRQEYSLLGEFGLVEMTMQLTDAVALSSTMIYDFDIKQPAQTTAGGLFQHSPEFASFAEVRYINALDVTYLDFGVSYALTRRYNIAVGATYDTDEEDFQRVNTTIRRRGPEATLGVSFSYDNIADETGIGVVFEPQGIRQDQLDRLRGLGR